MAVGDGNCLAHHDILDYAKIPQSEEKYRLQLCRAGALVELWLDNDEWEERTRPPSRQEILDHIVHQYGETIEQIEAQVRPALQKFMGDVPVKVIPLGSDQVPYFKNDERFMDHLFAENRKLRGE